MNTAHLIEFQHTGNELIGMLDIAETGKQIPFEVKRVFWTHSVPNGTIRGKHAHKITEQLLIAVKGKIIVTTEKADGNVEKFELTNSTEGVYLPPNVWHTMAYFDDAVQLVFCSTVYREDDYLRNYEQFKEYYKS